MVATVLDGWDELFENYSAKAKRQESVSRCWKRFSCIMNPCLLVFGASASQPTLIKAVARFLITGVGGIIASAEGPSLLGGSWRYFPPETAPKRYFHHSEKSTTNKREKASVFSAYIEYTKHLQQFETVHLQANFIGGFCFLLLTICTHRPWTKQFLGHENGKQLQVTTIKITASKENISIHNCPAAPRWLRLCLSHSI